MFNIKKMRSESFIGHYQKSLYNAISHQMTIKKIHPFRSMKELRAIAADYMAEHSEEFLPFLVNDDEDLSFAQGM